MRIRLLRSPLLLLARAAAAQELEPRSYSASPDRDELLPPRVRRAPTGTCSSIRRSRCTDVNAKRQRHLAGVRPRLQRSAGSKHSSPPSLPYSRPTLLRHVPRDGHRQHALDRTGIGDLRVKFSANFIGSPALTPAEFAKTPPQAAHRRRERRDRRSDGPVLPGQRRSTSATNRWAFKPEVGASYNRKAKLYLDFYAGVWLFAANPSPSPPVRTSSRRTRS